MWGILDLQPILSLSLLERDCTRSRSYERTGKSSFSSPIEWATDQMCMEILPTHKILSSNAVRAVMKRTICEIYAPSV